MQTKIKMPPYIMVETNEALAYYCSLMENKKYLILDTEFVRVRTYFPQLGLIQVFDGEYLLLIDPLNINQFSPFVSLLKNKNILKILHGCSEDLVIFQQEFKQLPTPLLDTQVMCRFLGLGQNVGLAKLLQYYLDVELDKSETRTNWVKRPLTEKQLNYAAFDVWYLLPLFEKIEKELKNTKYFNAVKEECDDMLEKARQVADPFLSFLTPPVIHHFTPLQLSRLKILVEWREKEAKKRNLAVNFVLKKEKLYSLAKEGAKNSSDLLDLGLLPHEIRYYGKTFLRLLEQAKKQIDNIKLETVYQIDNYKWYFKTIKQELELLVPDFLSEELLTNKKRIDEFLIYYFQPHLHPPIPSLLYGWRKPFGEKMLILLKEIDENKK